MRVDPQGSEPQVDYLTLEDLLGLAGELGVECLRVQAVVPGQPAPGA